MAGPLVGALFLGMVSAGPGQTPVMVPTFAQGLPTPQCVVCGPANRRGVASLDDWSNASAKARYLREVEGRSEAGLRDLVMQNRLGMTEQQVSRLTDYAGA